MSGIDSKWRKSTRSNTGSCVEVRRQSDEIQVRDTKNRRGPVLTFTTEDWRGFVAAVQAGHFDKS